MMTSPSVPVAATGNQEGLPSIGGNPIAAVTKQPPQLGLRLPGNPGSKEGFVRPSWFAAGTSAGRRFAEGRLGSAGPLKPSRQGLPAAISQMAASPEMSTDYAFGWPTNYIVPYSKIVRNYKLPLLTAPQKHMLMIGKQELREPGYTRKGEERRYTLLNIPAWNYLQARTERMPSSPEEVVGAEQVWRDWSVEGIVRNEEGADDPNYGSGRESERERLLNLIIRGYAFPHNAWGPNVGPGTRLFIVLTKRKISTKTDWTLNPGGETDVRTPMATGRASLTNKPFQIAFWAHRDFDTPPDSVLQYTDEFGNRHRGLAIYLGFAETGSGSGGRSRTSESVNRSVSAILAQPQMWIFFDSV